MSYKIVIIGGGPGGYVAAIRGAQLGAKVALVENHKIGGTCLNYGCIPTKAFFKSAQLIDDMKHASSFGLKAEGVQLDADLLQAQREKVVTELTTGVEQVLKANGVDLISGTASFKSNNRLEIQDSDGKTSEIEAENYIIATGSKVFLPPLKGIENEHVVTSKELLEFEKLPEKLVILGGGVIAMEFASIFNSFGSEVTVVARSSILKTFDSDVTKRTSAYLKKSGIKILTNTNVLEISSGENGAEVLVEGKKGQDTLSADLILSATGRKPNHTGLNLEATDIELAGAAIKVDELFRTNVKGVYAIGDVNGKYMLAHAASHQGVHVVESIMGHDHADDVNISMNIVPSCVFITPELASVGMTETEAKEAELDYKVSKFPFTANGKALTMNHTEGFVKLISGEAGTLVGAQILGAHASDLIHEITLAISNGLSVSDITKTIHAHPTLSESIAEAAYGLLDGALHLAPMKKKK